ncbi:MAG: CAP domain-containing protein [Acidimicrobiia bacterium]
MERWSTRVILALLVVTGMFGLAPARAEQSVAPNDAEVQFFDLINQERAKQGLDALQRDPGLDAVARNWSGSMQLAGKISHRPDLAAQIASVEPQWRRGGENVGVGGTVPSLHTAFMNSPGHRDNVLGNWNRIGVGAVVQNGVIWVTMNFLLGPDLPADRQTQNVAPTTNNPPSGNLWLVTANGAVHAYGTAQNLGALDRMSLVDPIVGMSPTVDGNGYWMVAGDGGIFAFGNAPFYGSVGGRHLNQPVVAMATTPSGSGYWMVASDGGVFAFGDAGFYGSMGGRALTSPINGIAATPSGKGYWMVAGDGGIFAFGDAAFYGSLGGQRLTAPINGIAATPSGKGYWMVGKDGKVYTFGDAVYYGSANAGTTALSKISPLPDGSGYRMVAADGRVFSFGASGSSTSGSLGLTQPIVALANKA